MSTPAVEIRHLTKRFGDTVAVDDVSLTIEDGQLLCLLGPSGCGKTTLLRMLAGLIEPTEGEIYLRGRCVYSSEKGIFVPPAERGVGLMFQNYALWPHMTVRDNIMYGLRVQKVPKQEAAERVARVARMLGIEGLLSRYPSELSGGQQQRVSLARMVVVFPGIILMDEPLSNLDAKLRVHTRVELRRLQRELKMTGVYVTHDQEEALALADKIAVMHNGKVLQLGSPVEVYEHSRHVFVADFLGTPPPNLVPAAVETDGAGSRILIPEFGELRLAGRIDQHEVTVSIRPEDCEVRRGRDAGAGALPEDAAQARDGAHLKAHLRVVSSQFMGAHFLVVAQGETGISWTFRHDKHQEPFAEGDTIEVLVKRDAINVYARPDGRLLARGAVLVPGT